MVFTAGDGSFHILIAPYLEEQGVRAARIGPIVAAYSVAALGFRFLIGLVYRAEWIRFIVPAGCLLQAMSFVVVAYNSDPAILTVATSTSGMGFAIASTGGLAAVMEMRPASNAGVLMGWYTGCISVGYAISGFLGGFAGDVLGLSGAFAALAMLPVLAAVGFAAAAWRVASSSSDEDEAAPPETAGAIETQKRSRALRASINPLVVLAFFCALHINLLSGVLQTFFPLYGLTIGLSLTQIGALQGLHSTVSSAIRFATPALFRRIHYRRFLPWAVILGGLATAAVTLSTMFVALAVAWAFIGVSRALLRVSSAALAMDAAGGDDRRRGTASGVYMSGLDVGKIIAPVLGGISVDGFGYEATFVITGLGVPLVFFAYYAWLKWRPNRSLDRATTCHG